MKNDKWGGSSSSSDLTEEPTDISVRFSRGLDYLRNAEVDKAKQVFDEIISEDPEYAPAFFGLSCVHIRLDARELALKFMERALELDPRYGEAHLVLARLLYEDGDLVGGYDHVKKAVQSGVSPDSGNELINSLIQSRPRSDIIVETTDDELEKSEKDEELLEMTKHRGLDISDVVSKNYIQVLRSYPSEVSKYLRNDVNFTRVFIFSFFTRILAFSIIPTDWKPVSYHLWQIGYFTLHRGIAAGRMWDLHGAEYLYSVLPSMTQSFLMWLFHTNSMLPFRFLNIILSSITAALIYKISSEYFDHRVGIYAAIFVAVFPGILIWNLLNLYETMATFFFVLSLYNWKKRSFFSGILLGLATQSRMEFWLSAPAVCITPLLFEKDGKFEKFLPRFLGWTAITIPFLFFFQTRTGNAIYPLFYGLFGGFGGDVREGVQSSLSLNLQVWRGFWILTVLGSLGILYYLKRHNSDKYQIYAYSLAPLGVRAFRWIFWPSGPFYEGLFPLTQKYLLATFVVGSIPLFKVLSKKVISRIRLDQFFLIITILALMNSVFILRPLARPRAQEKEHDIDYVKKIMSYYEGGTVICDYVVFNYYLVSEGLTADNLQGSFYTPLYYGDTDIESLESWFDNLNATIWVQTWKKASGEVLNKIENEAPYLLTLIEDNIFLIN